MTLVASQRYLFLRGQAGRMMNLSYLSVDASLWNVNAQCEEAPDESSRNRNARQ